VTRGMFGAKLPSVSALMGSAEIAALLDVSRQRVQQLINQPDFPSPIAQLAMGKVWCKDDVISWAQKHGRDISV
jgi:predicted DNA-binding transcriptional regulator AlpA